jgi:hypothetical protein
MTDFSLQYRSAFNTIYMRVKMSTYTHARLNDEVHSISGFYCPRKEGVLPYKGREVLFVIGQATMDNACCTNGCWEYALVPGYVVRWQDRTDPGGQPLSEVEPIRDSAARADIGRLIKDSSGVNQVDFR